MGEICYVAFDERDDDENGEADGTLGVNVDLGAPNTLFDIGVDIAGCSADPDQPHIDIGLASSLLDVHVNELPTRFEACVRENADEPPDPLDSLSSDALLAPVTAPTCSAAAATTSWKRRCCRCTTRRPAR